MQNSDKTDKSPQNLDQAINTLADQAKGGDMAARVAETYGSTAQGVEGAKVVQGASGSPAAFNANGDPNAADDNVATEGLENDPVSEQDLSEATSEDLDPNEYITDLNNQIVTLQGQIEILKADNAKLQDKMLRAIAESENVRKRAAQDIERDRKFALEKFVRALLPVYDALEKAVEMTDKENEATKATYEGVVNTLNLYLKEMQSFGVEVVDPTGQPFDPNFHQAVTMVPAQNTPNNHVMATMQKGFLLNGRVVRPAMVVVAKQP